MWPAPFFTSNLRSLVQVNTYIHCVTIKMNQTCFLAKRIGKFMMREKIIFVRNRKGQNLIIWMRLRDEQMCWSVKCWEIKFFFFFFNWARVKKLLLKKFPHVVIVIPKLSIVTIQSFIWDIYVLLKCAHSAYDWAQLMKTNSF